jgi:hypothetical protein
LDLRPERDVTSDVYSSVWEGLRVPQQDAARFRFTLRQLLGLITGLSFLFGAILWLSQIAIVTRSPSSSRASKSQLHALHQALQAYSADYGCYPPVATYSWTGRPLQSWRTHLLQLDYLPRKFVGYDMREPWDSPTNRRYHSSQPAFFRSGNDRHAKVGTTSFFAIVLPDARPGDPFAVIELPGNQVPFLQPRDVTWGEILATNTRKDALRVRRAHGAWVHVLWPDGNVERLDLDEFSPSLRSGITEQ